MEIGDIIRKRRIELGLTLDDVAKFAGTTRQNINKYEKGAIKNIPQQRIEGIAKALKLTPAELCGWDVQYITAIEEQLDGIEPTIADKISGRLRKLSDDELQLVDDFISFIVYRRR